MTKKRTLRNNEIKKQIHGLVDTGMKVKDAIKLVADKFYLSYHHVSDIWYGKDKKVNSHVKTGETKIKSHLAPALILLTVLADQCFLRL